MAGFENSTLAGRYFLKRLAGEGGMAQVYQAWDPDRSTYLAIKVIHEMRFFESFLREAVVLGKLAHPNIVRLYSVEKDDSKQIVFIVMDWVDGKDLKGILEERQHPLEVAEVCAILDCVHKALHYAHKLDVCHCDIKPANILLKNSDHQAILSDFGLAQVTHGQGSGGTFPYMAPELFLGGKVSVATDVYALGVTLYQLLSRHLPFEGKPRDLLIQEQIGKPPTPIRSYNPGLPDGVVAVIERALAKDPSRRPASVTDLWVDFSRCAQGPQRHPPVSSPVLIGLQGEITGHKIRIPAQGMTIGRSTRNQLCLKELSVSREHAVITCKQGRFYIRDRGSKVGTYHNAHKLHDQEEELRNGDTIKFGVSEVFEFRSA